MTTTSAPPTAPQKRIRPGTASVLVDHVEVGKTLRLQWCLARAVLERAGLKIIDGTGPRQWYLSRSTWRQFLAKNDLAVQ